MRLPEAESATPSDRLTRRALLGGLGGVAVSAVACHSPGRSVPEPVSTRPPDAMWARPDASPMQIAHEVVARGSGRVVAELGPAASGGDRGEVDLVIVGAGISGLAAAHFYRRAHPEARILLLEAGDEFGGHAVRDEVIVGGRTLLCHGGSQSLQDPHSYSEDAAGLLQEIGVDLEGLRAGFDDDFFARHGLGSGMFFDRASFGVDRLVRCELPFVEQFMPAAPSAPIADACERFPISAEARAQLRALFRADPDTARVSEAELATLTYPQYLERRLGTPHGEVLRILERALLPLTTAGVAALPAGLLIQLGLPGPTGARQRILREPYRYHFPDGNASVARLLVARLIPDALRAADMRDAIDRRVDTSKLDRAGAPCRLRLGATVVQVRHDGNPARATGVEVTYVRSGRVEKVRGRAAILACYAGFIPHIWPELPRSQREALQKSVKAPLVYASVFLNRWRALARSGVGCVYSPGARFSALTLDFPVDLGAYRYSAHPEEPAALHAEWVPIGPGDSLWEQHRAARRTLLATRVETLEDDLARSLEGMFGPHGFSAQRDIATLKIRVHAHGYAPDADLYGEVSAGRQPFTVRGRAPLGRIAIAGSDAGGTPYLDGAIDQARRAVDELSRTLG